MSFRASVRSPSANAAYASRILWTFGCSGIATSIVERRRFLQALATFSLMTAGEVTLQPHGDEIGRSDSESSYRHTWHARASTRRESRRSQHTRSPVALKDR